MKWQNYSSTRVNQQSQQIFSRFWIRWDVLTQSEQVVCACIVLIPLWWLWGWSYLTFILATSIIAYQIFAQGSLQLKKPSLFVITGILIGLYEVISIYFWGIYNNEPLSVRAITDSIITWIAPATILWYITSYKIRVRLEVIAWAFSIVVIQMLVFWLIIYFIWKQADYIPFQSLFGMLTGKGDVFIPGVGNSNFLMPYFASDNSIPGMVRYVFFFHGPESLALVVGFICLLALDMKHKAWSLLLFSSSFFLLLLSGTRSAWISLPIVLLIRWVLKTAKNGKLWLIFVVIAIISFVTLSVPSVNNVISKTTTHTEKATGQFRGDSTEVRAEIYRQTWQAFVDGSNNELIFGHVVPGETVLPGYAPAMVGSHSFLLSTLLYRNGLFGTGLFLIFWSSLIYWFYQTRKSRPMSCLLVYLLFTFTFSVMEFESVVMPLVLITAVLYKLSIKSSTQKLYPQILINK